MQMEGFEKTTIGDGVCATNTGNYNFRMNEIGMYNDKYNLFSSFYSYCRHVK